MVKIGPITFVLHPRVINQHALLFICNKVFFYGDLKCLADSTEVIKYLCLHI